MSAAEPKVTEITPLKVSDDVEVLLLVGSRDRDGQAYCMAFTDTATSSAESAARTTLSSSHGDFMRCVAIVRVRVPRSLMRERGTEAGS